MHWQSSGPNRKCFARLEHGGVAKALSSVTPEEQCKVGCDDVGGVGVPVRHERCDVQSGDDGTEDQGVREMRERRDSGVLEDW